MPIEYLIGFDKRMKTLLKALLLLGLPPALGELGLPQVYRAGG